MLKHTEIKKGKIIIVKNHPHEVLEHKHSVKGRGKSVVQVQLKNLKTKSVFQMSFRGGDEVEEADLEKMEAVFVYSHRGKNVFHKKSDPSYRFALEEEVIGDRKDYLAEGTPVTATLFEEEIIGISLPVKIVLKVKEAPPGIKGNSAEGGTKNVVLQTGKVLETPLFIGQDDLVEVNTETGEYVRRIKKA